GTKNFLSVETLRMDGDWAFSIGVLANYARNPFEVLSCRSNTDCKDKNAMNVTDTKVIQDMGTLDLLLAVSPIRRLQIGLRAPVSYVSGQGFDITSGQGQNGGLHKFGVGDPTLELKVRVAGDAQDTAVFGFAGDVSFPVGHLFSDKNADTNAKAQDYYL